MKIKLFSLFSVTVFLIMAFITWQQILVFQMGYRVSSLKDELVNEEVLRQELIRNAHSRLSVNVVSSFAQNQLGMKTPGYSDTDILVLPVKLDDSKEKSSFKLLAYLSEFLSPPRLEAK